MDSIAGYDEEDDWSNYPNKYQISRTIKDISFGRKQLKCAFASPTNNTFIGHVGIVWWMWPMWGTSSPEFISLTQGTGINQRVGETVRLKKLYVNIEIQPNADANNNVRFVVWKKPRQVVVGSFAINQAAWRDYFFQQNVMSSPRTLRSYDENAVFLRDIMLIKPGGAGLLTSTNGVSYRQLEIDLGEVLTHFHGLGSDYGSQSPWDYGYALCVGGANTGATTNFRIMTQLIWIDG